MSKLLSFLSVATLLVCLSSCDNGNTGDSSTNNQQENSSSSSTEDKKEWNLLGEDYTNCKSIEKGTVSNWNDDYKEDMVFRGSKFASDEQTYKNNVLTNGVVTPGAQDDVKHVFYNLDGYARFVSVADGYAITIPTSTTLETDFSLGKYRSKLYNEEFTLTVSDEFKSSPYENSKEKWETYREEYLFGYLDNKDYLEKNRLKYTRTPRRNDETFFEGHIVDQYDIEIEDPLQIKKYFYNIAVIRTKSLWNQFDSYFMLLMKSTTDRSAYFDLIVKSYTKFDKKGTPNNSSLSNLPTKENPNWNEETKAYYNQLLTQQKTGWGAFVANLPKGKMANYQNSDIYKETTELENLIDYKFDIIPTYQHLSWGTRESLTSESTQWPESAAIGMANGNGVNGLPIVQYTYQFTINNNGTKYNSTGNNAYTPMFDLYRGTPGDDVKYLLDANNVYIRNMKKLAKEVKKYGKPVLFRLNNEMNTDWTSYCGMITLLDPDIFQATWRIIYNIFEEEGVDNCIWIFNPFSHSFPTGKWGEDMCYYPGIDYVQSLGLTYYRFNNIDNEVINEYTFRDDYTYLYNKNNDIWQNYPWIISEFACGSGGEASGKLYRFQDRQAAYVKGMLADFNDRANHPYLQNIKGAVWFSTNDYTTNSAGKSIISNALELNSNLPKTLQAFKEGLAKNK